MKRFISSLSIAAAVVVLLGGLVVVTAGRTGATPGTVAAGGVLSQAEDGAADEDEATPEPPAPALLPIEVLLDQLAGRGEGNALPTGQRVLLSRDPFRRVVPEPATSDGGATDGGAGGVDGGGTDGGGTDGGGTDGGGTDGGGTDGGGTDGGGTVDACTGDENETVCDGVVVTVDGFDEDGNALVTVDGTTFTVGVDDDFATSFRVLAVNDPCVTLLYGDEAFSICVGSTVLK